MTNKIGILTYHTGYNYGASLQNFALQTVIRKMGYDVETINFETEEFVSSQRVVLHFMKLQSLELIKDTLFVDVYGMKI